MLAVRWLHGDSASSPAMLYVVRCMSCTAWCISCTATRGRRPSWSRRRRLRKSRESGGSAQTHSVRRVCAQLCPTMRARPSVRPVRRCEYSSTPSPLLRPACPSVRPNQRAPVAEASTLRCISVYDVKRESSSLASQCRRRLPAQRHSALLYRTSAPSHRALLVPLKPSLSHVARTRRCAHGPDLLTRSLSRTRECGAYRRADRTRQVVLVLVSCTTELQQVLSYQRAAPVAPTRCTSSTV